MIRFIDNAVASHPEAHTAPMTGDIFQDLRSIAAIVLAIQQSDRDHWAYAHSPYPSSYAHLRYTRLNLYIRASAIGLRYFYIFEGAGPSDWSPVSTADVTMGNSHQYYACQLLPQGRYESHTDKSIREGLNDRR